jgi:hypothetical protein
MSRFFVATVAAEPGPVFFDIEIDDEAAMAAFDSNRCRAIAIIAQKYLLSGGRKPYPDKCDAQENSENPGRDRNLAMTDDRFPGVFVWVRE